MESDDDGEGELDCEDEGEVELEIKDEGVGVREGGIS